MQSQLNTSNHSCDKADFRVPKPTPISDHTDPKMKKVTFSFLQSISASKNVSSIHHCNFSNLIRDSSLSKLLFLFYSHCDTFKKNIKYEINQ